MDLGLYIANMFSAVKSASIQQKADIVKVKHGHPWLIPCCPKILSQEQDIIQRLDQSRGMYMRFDLNFKLISVPKCLVD